jgi:hypothetical protein
MLSTTFKGIKIPSRLLLAQTKEEELDDDSNPQLELKNGQLRIQCYDMNEENNCSKKR